MSESECQLRAPRLAERHLKLARAVAWLYAPRGKRGDPQAWQRLSVVAQSIASSETYMRFLEMDSRYRATSLAAGCRENERQVKDARADVVRAEAMVVADIVMVLGHVAVKL